MAARVMEVRGLHTAPFDGQPHLVISQKYLEIFMSISITMLQANKNVLFDVWTVPDGGSVKTDVTMTLCSTRPW
ncbi:hypothetical protein U0070_007422 [Myodes glareolus]|uniref:Uncharacterized protein n=1 Tax=Myodes glareolus TaxID=447135 RepID=A0AAW0HYC3_MYOGA